MNQDSWNVCVKTANQHPLCFESDEAHHLQYQIRQLYVKERYVKETSHVNN